MEKNTKITIPVHGCLTVAILTAICIIAVKECKRADMRYEREKIIHKKFMDSINNTKTNVIKYDTIRTK